MQLYSSLDCLHCHQIRLVLAEKGISVELIFPEKDSQANDDLAELNPYADTPTLVDRDIKLYGPSVILSYLDERYPHPPLMPIDPISRARLRLAHYRIERDWYSLADQIVATKQEKVKTRLVRELRESITAADDMFGVSKFLLNEELSLIDCHLVPFMWRLPKLGVNISRNASNVQAYVDRMIERPAFKSSLTEAEKQLAAA